jgi:predicted RNase H-like HicB family nuclease
VCPKSYCGDANEFTAVIERDGDWFVAWSPEVPGANGQGATLEACRENLAEAIRLILRDRREDGLKPFRAITRSRIYLFAKSVAG